MTTRDEQRDWTGVLGWGLVVLFLLAWTALVPLRLVQRLGWRESPAEAYLGGPPDVPAAEAMAEAAQAAGLGSQGVRIHILTLTLTGERVAFVQLDASKGYRWRRLLDWEELREALTVLASAGEGLDLQRLALVYLSETGQSVLTLTTPLRAVSSYQRGALTSAGLLLQVKVDANLRLLAAEVSP